MNPLLPKNDVAMNLASNVYLNTTTKFVPLIPNKPYANTQNIQSASDNIKSPLKKQIYTQQTKQQTGYRQSNGRTSGIEISKLSDLGPSSLFKGLDDLNIKPLQYSDRSKPKNQSIPTSNQQQTTHFERKQKSRVLYNGSNPHQDTNKKNVQVPNNTQNINQKKPPLSRSQVQQISKTQTGNSQTIVRKPVGRNINKQPEQDEVLKSQLSKNIPLRSLIKVDIQKQSSVITKESSGYVYKPPRKHYESEGSAQVENIQSKPTQINQPYKPTPVKLNQILSKQKLQNSDLVQTKQAYPYSRTRSRQVKQVQLNLEVNTNVSYFKVQVKGSDTQRSSTEKPVKKIQYSQQKHQNIPLSRTIQKSNYKQENVIKPQQTSTKSQIGRPTKLIVNQNTKVESSTLFRQGESKIQNNNGSINNSNEPTRYVYRPRGETSQIINKEVQNSTSQVDIASIITKKNQLPEKKTSVTNQSSKKSKEDQVNQIQQKKIVQQSISANKVSNNYPYKKQQQKPPQSAINVVQKQQQSQVNNQVNKQVFPSKSSQNITKQNTQITNNPIAYNGKQTAQKSIITQLQKPINRYQKQVIQIKNDKNITGIQSLSSNTTQLSQKIISPKKSAPSNSSSGYVYKPPMKKSQIFSNQNFSKQQIQISKKQSQKSVNMQKKTQTDQPTSNLNTKSKQIQSAKLNNQIIQEKVTSGLNQAITDPVDIGKTYKIENRNIQITEKKSKNLLENNSRYNKAYQSKQKITLNQIKTHKIQINHLSLSSFTLIGILVKKKIKSNYKFSFSKIIQFSNSITKKTQSAKNIATKSNLFFKSYQQSICLDAFYTLKKYFTQTLPSSKKQKIIPGRVGSKDNQNPLTTIDNKFKNILFIKINELFKSNIKTTLTQITKKYNSQIYRQTKLPLFQSLDKLMKNKTVSIQRRFFSTLKFTYHLNKQKNDDILPLIEARNKKWSKQEIIKFFENLSKSHLPKNSSIGSFLLDTPDKKLSEKFMSQTKVILSPTDNPKNYQYTVPEKGTSKKVTLLQSRLQDLQKEIAQQQKTINDKQRQFASRKLQVKRQMNTTKKQSDIRRKQNNDLKDKLKKIQPLPNLLDSREPNNSLFKNQSYGIQIQTQQLNSEQKNQYLDLLADMYVDSVLKIQREQNNQHIFEVDQFINNFQEANPIIKLSFDYLLNGEDYSPSQVEKSKFLQKCKQSIKENILLKDNINLKHQISLYENSFIQQNTLYIDPKLQNLNQEMQTLKNLIKNYIKQRYLWHWIQKSIESV